MEREDIFDEEFCSKLKAFYSCYESPGISINMGYRRTGRTYKLAKILLETAVESGREIKIIDHYLDKEGTHQTFDHMGRTIERAVQKYKEQGVDITFRFNIRGDSFSAYLIGGKQNYMRLRNNPFPIKLIEQRKEFLLKRRLLLL